jgi:hypothetical protein
VNIIYLKDSFNKKKKPVNILKSQKKRESTSKKATEGRFFVLKSSKCCEK